MLTRAKKFRISLIGCLHGGRTFCLRHCWILGIIALGFIIKYPDTVDGQISVTAHAAPVRLVANTSGKMYLLRESGDYLCKGDVIAYIESGADYRDILYLDSTLRSTGFENTGMDPSLPGDLISVTWVRPTTLYGCVCPIAF